MNNKAAIWAFIVLFVQFFLSFLRDQFHKVVFFASLPNTSKATVWGYSCVADFD